MKDKDHTVEDINSGSKCPRCGYEFGGVCYLVTHEDGHEETLCDCCVGLLAFGFGGGAFEDGSGWRARVEYVELG